jgi:hypothetical protein
VVARVTAYPNPAKNTLNVVNNGGYVMLQILNASGMLLYTCPIVEGQNLVNISSLPSGIYFVRLSASKVKPYTLKVLVKSAGS